MKKIRLRISHYGAQKAAAELAVTLNYSESRQLIAAIAAYLGVVASIEDAE